MLTLIGALTFVLVGFNFHSVTKMYYLFVISTAFSASSIFVISGSNAGLQPSFLVGIVFIFVFFKYKTFLLTEYSRQYLLLVAAFLLISLISIFNPLLLNYLNIDYEIFNVAVEKLEKESLGNFKQYIYLIFFISTSITTSFFIKDINVLYKTVKYFLLVSTFSVFWGLFIHEGSIILGFEYPSFIFNNHAGYAQGYNQEIYGFVKRVCSIAQEPSVYGYYLTFSMTILFYLSNKKVWLFKKNNQKMMLFMHIIMLFLTTSSTAIISLLIFLFILVLIEIKAMRKSLYYIIFGAPLFLILFYIIINYIFKFYLNLDLIDLINILTIDKLQDGSSGDERFSFYLLGLKNVFDTYFIGSGYGVNRTFDINTTLLSNIGLLGWLSFLVMNFFPIIKTFKLLKYVRNKEDEFLIRSLLFSYIMALIIMSLSIPDFVNMYFWLFFGIILAIPNLIMEKKNV